MKSDAYRRIVEFVSLIRKDYSNFIGFPGSTDFEYSELFPTFRYLLNNVGDPMVSPLHANHSKSFEREIVTFIADLFRAPKRDRWGYVTNGGTEGNMYALYLARSLYPDARVYYSSAAHYSIPKSLHLLAMKGVEVGIQGSGEMDYSDFRKKVAENHRHPVIVVATIGTTMSEARDNIYIIKRVLAEENIEQLFIHCDAALAGMYTALLEPHHPFDFKDGADSISISGHKFIGCPMPCGVVVTKKSHRDLVVRDSRYVGSPDTTISGSRNGHTPIMLWYAIQNLGREGLRERAVRGVELAEYLTAELQVLGWPVRHNTNALTVVIKTPPKSIVQKWQLATYAGWSHIICMPGVTKTKLTHFIDDIKNYNNIKSTSNCNGIERVYVKE